MQWTTQSDLHLAAAHTVSSVAANAVNLFTHAGGIQAIAGNGPVSLQAHTDGLEILSFNAKEKIVLQSGQSSITLDGGNITFACPGNFTVKGGAASVRYSGKCCGAINRASRQPIELVP